MYSTYSGKSETEKHKRSRAVRVMCLLHEYNMPDIWTNKSDKFVIKGALDLSDVVGKEQLPGVEFMLCSDALRDITSLT